MVPNISVHKPAIQLLMNPLIAVVLASGTELIYTAAANCLSLPSFHASSYKVDAKIIQILQKWMNHVAPI